MPVLFVFLLKVNAALLLFCAGYYLVLRHLTFYTLNRIYLVTAILFASVYPQINLSEFAQRHQHLTNPVQAVVYQLQAPAQTLIKPFTQPNYWYWMDVVFWTGAALLAVRLLVQLFSLYKLYHNSTATNIYDHNVRVINGNGGPFSFWKSIYVNPANHEADDLKSILLHEQVHVNEWHTLDILLAELSTIFYWFNPGVWLMKKAVRENIEFITDRKILNNGVDSKQYQYSLVSVSFATASPTIVNHFNISTIKKRIIMMNAKRSSKFNLTRYAFLVPAVVILLLVFTISKAALIKKSTNAYKALATTVTNIAKETKPGNPVQHTSKPAIIKMEQIITTAPANYIAGFAKLIDSVRNGNFFVSTSDSLYYVINGVKSTEAEFKAIDHNKIMAISILPSEVASKLIDKLDKNHSVLFVTTKDSEAGKKFKEKVEQLDVRKYNMAFGNGVSVGGAKGRNVVVVGGYGSHNLSTGTGQSYTLSRTFSGNGDSIHTVYLNGRKFYGAKGKDSIIFKHMGGGGRVVYGLSAKYDTIHTRNNARGIYKNDTLKSFNSTGNFNRFDTLHNRLFTAVTMNRAGVNGVYTLNNRTTIDLGENKMVIMIDGKEASQKDMKNLSAADIKTLSIGKGDDMVKKYGEKAKNGVLIITTKKAN